MAAAEEVVVAGRGRCLWSCTLPHFLLNRAFMSGTYMPFSLIVAADAILYDQLAFGGLPQHFTGCLDST